MDHYADDLAAVVEHLDLHDAIHVGHSCEDDQVVPYAASGPKTARLLKNGILRTYRGYPHGMPTTHADTINADLLAFLKS